MDFSSDAILMTDEPYSMTEERLRHRHLKPPRGKYLPQLYCALTGSVCFGIVLGWSCPVIMQRSENEHSKSEILVIAGLAPLGASMGCVLFQVLSERRGPRTVVLVICPFQVLCWILLAAIDNFKLYKWMIFCSGLLSIGLKLCGETLIWDSVHLGYTRQFRILFDSSVLFGVFVSYILGYANPQYFSLTGVFAVTLTFFMYVVIPESPVTLFGQDPAKAERALFFLRGKSYINDEMRLIKKDYELRTNDIPAKYMFLRRAVYRPTLLILGIIFFREFTGHYSLIAFGLTFVDDERSTGIPLFLGKSTDSFILGICLYISRVISCLIFNHGGYGVRKPIITSSILVTIWLGCLAILFYFDKHHGTKITKISSIKIILYCLYIFSYDAGYNHIPGLIEVEYLPFQVYPWVRLLTVSCEWLFACLMILIYIAIGHTQNSWWKTYTFLFCVSLVGTIFNCVFVIESKGKSLVQVQAMFGGRPVGSRSSRLHKRRNISDV